MHGRIFDPKIEEAIEYIAETGIISDSYIFKNLNINYPRAARLLFILEELRIISTRPMSPSAERVMLVDKETALAILNKARDALKGMVGQ